MPVSKRLRYEILRRDNHACRYCGATAPDVKLTVDHVVPVALGGTDKPDNLVTACADCNAGKSASQPDASLVADVNQDALRWAQAVKRASEIAMRQRDELIEIEQAVHGAFADTPVPSYRGGGTLADYLPSDWFDAVHRYFGAGLTCGDLVDAAYIAAGAKVPPARAFRYFCGVCIRKVEERHEAARALLDTEDNA